MGRLDAVKARAFRLMARTPGVLGDAVRRANDALGRPLAPEAELEDRAQFAAGYQPAASGAAAAAVVPARPPVPTTEAAPVIVYHLEKHRRDLPRFTQVLDGAEIPYRIMNLEGDPATIAAVRRDSGGRKLPLVFVAGECVGGREELNALDKSGELRKKVWP